MNLDDYLQRLENVKTLVREGYPLIPVQIEMLNLIKDLARNVQLEEE